MNKPVEVETKYNAQEILLTDFVKFCKSLKPTKTITASSPDHFYENSNSPDSFFRHRIGPKLNQLTLKRKLSDKNNYVRIEHNIDLKKASESEIESFVHELGYTKTKSLFKTYTVFFYGNHSLVYYIVYDSNMKELGRFIEIEMSEDHSWKDEKEAWDALTNVEANCKLLGVTAQGRLKRSLYEMFVKGGQ